MKQWAERLCLAVGGALVLLTLIGVFSSAPTQEPVDHELIVRQLGHDYLRTVGDSTSRIPPISEGANEALILRTGSFVAYDTLAKVARQTFRQAGITSGYTLSIEDCQSGNILLGSVFPPPVEQYVSAPGETACIGRDQEDHCANIVIRFQRNEKTSKNAMNWLAGGLGIMLICLGFFRPRNDSVDPVVKLQSGVLQITPGVSLDETALKLKTPAGTDTLTFREAKLLAFLARRPNEVLPRERIHDEVWADEGVITGRSLDVFVSRLRKKLAGVDDVEIQTVHGIGYRFRVNA